MLKATSYGRYYILNHRVEPEIFRRYAAVYRVFGKEALINFDMAKYYTLYGYGYTNKWFTMFPRALKSIKTFNVTFFGVYVEKGVPRKSISESVGITYNSFFNGIIIHFKRGPHSIFKRLHAHAPRKAPHRKIEK